MLFKNFKMFLNKNFQLTLAIIKPHVIKLPHDLQNIKDKIIQSNFKIVRSKRQILTVPLAEQFYEEHCGKFFFNRLVTFMTSGPSEFYILYKSDAIKDWRTIMGPTKVYKAQYSDPSSIRGAYGLSDTRNASHGSDSLQSAEREIKIFFPDFNIDNWFKTEEIFFRTDRVKFISENFIHIPINKL